jgi:transcriptional regulator with XRE-family HTH domain
MTIGKRLIKWRKIHNITQEEFCKRTGFKKEYISKIENDHLKNPTWTTIKALAGGFYITGKRMSPMCFLQGVD